MLLYFWDRHWIERWKLYIWSNFQGSIIKFHDLVLCTKTGKFYSYIGISYGYYQLTISVVEIVLISKCRKIYSSSNVINLNSIGSIVFEIWAEEWSESSKNRGPEGRFFQKLHVRSWSNFFSEYVPMSTINDQNIKAHTSISAKT